MFEYSGGCKPGEISLWDQNGPSSSVQHTSSSFITSGLPSPTTTGRPEKPTSFPHVNNPLHCSQAVLAQNSLCCTYSSLWCSGAHSGHAWEPHRWVLSSVVGCSCLRAACRLLVEAVVEVVVCVRKLNGSLAWFTSNEAASFPSEAPPVRRAEIRRRLFGWLPMYEWRWTAGRYLYLSKHGGPALLLCSALFIFHVPFYPKNRFVWLA